MFKLTIYQSVEGKYGKEELVFVFEKISELFTAVDLLINNSGERKTEYSIKVLKDGKVTEDED